MTGARKLVYVVNHVHEKDVTHLYHILNLIGTLKQRGWTVTLLSERGGVGRKVVAGHEVVYLSKSGYLMRAVRLAAQLLRLRSEGYRLAFVRISKLPAIICILLGKIIGIKVLYWHSAANFDIDRRKPLPTRAADDFLFNLIKWGVDGFVSGPEAMLEYYAVQYGVSRSKLKLLYNDVDTSRFSPKRHAAPSGSPIKILFVHRFSPIRQTWQYMPAIIERLGAAAIGCSIELLLVGDGPELHLVEKSAATAKTGVTVKFLGAIPNSELPKHYAEADIFIMPSYREGFPRVVVEAMASGLPVVTTDAGGTRDVLGPKQQRYVVSKDDPDSFAERLAELVQDGDRRAELAQENLLYVRRYSTETVAEMFENLLLGYLDDPEGTS